MNRHAGQEYCLTVAVFVASSLLQLTAWQIIILYIKGAVSLALNVAKSSRNLAVTRNMRNLANLFRPSGA